MQHSDLPTIIAAVTTALVTGVFAWLAGRRKNAADATLSISTGFDKLTRRLQEDNDNLRAEIASLRLEISRLRMEVTRSNYKPEGEGMVGY